MTAKPSSLRFESLDDAMFFYDVERRFGITLAQDDLANMNGDATLDDIAVIVERKLRATRAPRRACLSMATFHRLRQGLARTGNIGHFGPSTELRSILPKKRLIEIWRKLANEAKLDLPDLEWHPAMTFAYTGLWIVVVLVLAVTGGSPLAFLPFVLMLTTLPLITANRQFIPQRLPSRLKTLRDLTEHTLPLNYGRLSREYDTAHPDDIWNALAYVARRNSCGPESMLITRETRLYP